VGDTINPDAVDPPADEEKTAVEGDAHDASAKEEEVDEDAKATAVFNNADGTEWLKLEEAPGGWADASRALMASGKVENAKLQGLWSITRPGGTKANPAKNVMEVEFVDSVRTGAYRQWYLSGSLEIEGQFQNGVPNGTWSSWNQNGKLLAITCYVGGAKQWTAFEATDAACGSDD
jgi:antitoxin component YwqK of YwqJK toxin-antitoxin module